MTLSCGLLFSVTESICNKYLDSMPCWLWRYCPFKSHVSIKINFQLKMLWFRPLNHYLVILTCELLDDLEVIKIKHWNRGFLLSMYSLFVCPISKKMKILPKRRLHWNRAQNIPLLRPTVSLVELMVRKLPWAVHIPRHERFRIGSLYVSQKYICDTNWTQITGIQQWTQRQLPSLPWSWHYCPLKSLS